MYGRTTKNDSGTCFTNLGLVAAARQSATAAQAALGPLKSYRLNETKNETTI